MIFQEVIWHETHKEIISKNIVKFSKVYEHWLNGADQILTHWTTVYSLGYCGLTSTSCVYRRCVWFCTFHHIFKLFRYATKNIVQKRNVRPFESFMFQLAFIIMPTASRNSIKYQNYPKLPHTVCRSWSRKPESRNGFRSIF